ncbi:hypothetical protein BPUTSESOX_174 [uncultured Gammaproteobacteria bacterium]|jgi:hypothetical protein|nr:hypothetical protein BPUTSESOX_174 [uncultured Gammaproteobacteria bacterium]
MSVEDKFQAKYSQYLENFKELNYDDINQQSLCQNTTHQCYNFDKIVKNRSDKPTPASPDTLIFKKNKIYCVEFKNSFFNRINVPNIKRKLRNGHQVLSAIFIELDLQLKDYQLIFASYTRKKYTIELDITQEFDLTYNSTKVCILTTFLPMILISLESNLLKK